MQHAFETFLAARDLRLPGLTVPDGIEAMLAFYASIRAPANIASDMLLYQWGTYDWGTGEHFELDITRQLILVGGEDEDVWQLHLTFRFAPSPAARALGAGHRWCDTPDGCDALRTFILASPASTFATVTPILDVQLEYACAG